MFETLEKQKEIQDNDFQEKETLNHKIPQKDFTYKRSGYKGSKLYRKSPVHSKKDTQQVKEEESSSSIFNLLSGYRNEQPIEDPTTPQVETFIDNQEDYEIQEDTNDEREPNKENSDFQSQSIENTSKQEHEYFDLSHDNEDTEQTYNHESSSEEFEEENKIEDESDTKDDGLMFKYFPVDEDEDDE